MTKEEMINAFRKKIKENPRGFNQEYLNQLELEVLDIIEKDNGWIKLKLVIHNFDYFEDFENEISCNGGVETFIKGIYFDIVSISDLLRKDPTVRKYIEEAYEEAEEILENNRIKNKSWFYKIFPFLEPEHRYMGTCHSIWYEQKRILKEKHNIDWQSPQDRLPDAKFD